MYLMMIFKGWHTTGTCMSGTTPCNKCHKQFIQKVWRDKSRDVVRLWEICDCFYLHIVCVSKNSHIYMGFSVTYTSNFHFWTWFNFVPFTLSPYFRIYDCLSCFSRILWQKNINTNNHEIVILDELIMIKPCIFERKNGDPYLW